MIVSVVKPRILVNATSLAVGGGIQIGISFIEHASRPQNADIEFRFAVSRPIFEGLPPALRSDERVCIFDISPARIIDGRHCRRRLREMETNFRADIVYSLGLPSYVRFHAPEVGRYTNGWETHPSALAWSSIPLWERSTRWLKNTVRRWWAGRASYFESQTEAAKAGIMRRMKVPADRVLVVPNAPNSIFLAEGEGLRAKVPGSTVEIFCLAADYRHKNLNCIPDVARVLRDLRPGVPFQFILTLVPEGRIFREIEEKCLRLGVRDMVVNLGPIKLSECPARYRASDIVFMPTLLETFSATYLEAMAMSVPIVATDLDFARSVCADAARYYDPRSARAAAEAILEVAEDHALRARLIEAGRARLKEFPDPERKHRIVLDWLGRIAVEARSRKGAA